uniref:No apical meristem-associated C-terminal domain-containing protein n=1 Tax=Oryza brachyantha TaxID=4533 RepID=J3MM06_ORYBR
MGSTNEGTYPASGFTNFLQSNCSPENFHLVGNITSSSTISPTAPSLKRTLPIESNRKEKKTIDVDADETIEDGRTEKRLNWMKEEDIRLASAWVHNSKDPVDGTDIPSDQYCADVHEEYNKTTEVCRRRNRNQLKIHWDRVKKPVTEFHGCWVQTNKVYSSGVSDDQLKEIAEKMYASSNNGKDFMLKHIWNVVRGERKWSAHVKKIEQEKEKNKGATNSPATVVNLKDKLTVRPIGHKKAKDERYGNKKTPEAYSAISEKLDKFIEVSTLARKDREKMSETQEKLANSKVEAARLNEKTAENQLKCKMLDTYELLLAPTTNLNAHALAEREKTLEGMRLALFAPDS